MAQLGSTNIVGDLEINGNNSKITTPDIVSTNGTITNLTVDALKFKINNVDTDLATTLLDLLYPVGSVYIYRGQPIFIDGNPVCPLKSKIGGNWKQLKNYFLYAVENGTGGDNKTSDETKGSNDAIIPEHTHDGTATINGVDVATGEAGAHRHKLSIDKNGGVDPYTTGDGTDRSRIVVTNGKEQGSITFDSTDLQYSIESSHDPIYMNAEAGHTHTVHLDNIKASVKTENPEDSKSVTNKNMPRYIEVYAWERIENDTTNNNE